MFPLVLGIILKMYDLFTCDFAGNVKLSNVGNIAIIVMCFLFPH